MTIIIDFVQDLLISPLFWAITLSLIAAQAAKIIILVFKHKEKFCFEDLFITGNMPSAHSAIVTAVPITLLLMEGYPSPLFFVSIVFAAIVIRDAVGVRRTVGEEGKVLTNVINILKSKFHIFIPRKMHQSLGHQPLEVFVGILIGIAASFAGYWIAHFFIVV